MAMSPAPIEEQRQRQVGAAVGTGTVGIIAGIVAVMLLSLVFIKLSDNVVERDYASFDRAIALGIHSTASTTQTAIMLVVTEFGNLIVIGLAALSLLLGAFIVIKARRHLTAGIAVAVIDTIVPVFTVLGAGLLSDIIKAVVGRARPHIFVPLAPQIGPSFPSGHTLVAISFYGICAFMLARPARPLVRVMFVLLAALITGGVAYSRVYLGVHYPTDVIGSLILGSAWLIIVILSLTTVEHHLQEAHQLKKVEEAIQHPPANIPGQDTESTEMPRTVTER